MAKRKLCAFVGNNLFSTVVFTSVILIIILCCLDSGRAQVQNSRGSSRRAALSRLSRRLMARNSAQRAVSQSGGERSRTQSQRTLQSRGQVSRGRSNVSSRRRRLKFSRRRGRTSSRGRIRQEDVARGRVRAIPNEQVSDRASSRLGSFDFFPSSINRFIDSLKDRIPNVGLGLGAKMQGSGSSDVRQTSRQRTVQNTAGLDRNRVDSSRRRSERTMSSSQRSRPRTSRRMTFPSVQPRMDNAIQRSDMRRRGTEPTLDRTWDLPTTPTESWLPSINFGRRGNSQRRSQQTQPSFIQPQPTQPTSFIDNSLVQTREPSGQTRSQSRDTGLQGLSFSSPGSSFQSQISALGPGNVVQDPLSFQSSNVLQEAPAAGQEQLVGSNIGRSFPMDTFQQSPQTVQHQPQIVQQPQLIQQPQFMQQPQMPQQNVQMPNQPVQQQILNEQPATNQASFIPQMQPQQTVHVQQPAQVSNAQTGGVNTVQMIPTGGAGSASTGIQQGVIRPQPGSLHSIMDMIQKLGSDELGIISRALQLLHSLRDPSPQPQVNPLPQNTGLFQTVPQANPQPQFHTLPQSVPVQPAINPQQTLPVIPVHPQPSLVNTHLLGQNNVQPTVNQVQGQAQVGMGHSMQGQVQGSVLGGQNNLLGIGHPHTSAQVQGQGQISNLNTNVQGQFQGQSSNNQLGFGNTGNVNIQGQMSNHLPGGTNNNLQMQLQNSGQSSQAQGQVQVVNGPAQVVNNQIQASSINTNVNQSPTQIVNQQTQIINNQPNPAPQQQQALNTVQQPQPVVVQQPQPIVVQQPQPMVVQQPQPMVAQQPQPMVAQQPQPMVPQPAVAQPSILHPQPMTDNSLAAVGASGAMLQNAITNGHSAGALPLSDQLNTNQALLRQLKQLQSGHLLDQQLAAQLTSLGTQQVAALQNGKPSVFHWGEGTTAPPIPHVNPAFNMGNTTPKKLLVEIDPNSRGLKLLPDGKGGVKVISIREAHTLSPFGNKDTILPIAPAVTPASNIVNTTPQMHITNETLRKLERTDRLNTTDVPEELEINGTSYEGNYTHPISPHGGPAEVGGSKSSPSEGGGKGHKGSSNYQDHTSKELDELEEFRMFPRTSPSYFDYPYYNSHNLDLLSIDVHGGNGKPDRASSLASQLFGLLKNSVSSAPSTLKHVFSDFVGMVKNTSASAPSAVKDVAMKLMNMVHGPTTYYNPVYTTTEAPFMIMDLLDRPSTFPTTTASTHFDPFHVTGNSYSSTTEANPLLSGMQAQNLHPESSGDILSLIRNIVNRKIKKKMAVIRRRKRTTVPPRTTRFTTTPPTFISYTNSFTTIPAPRIANFSESALPPASQNFTDFFKESKSSTKKAGSTQHRYIRPVSLSDYRKRRNRLENLDPTSLTTKLEERLDTLLLKALTSNNLHDTNGQNLDGLDSLIGTGKRHKKLVPKHKIRIQARRGPPKNSSSFDFYQSTYDTISNRYVTMTTTPDAIKPFKDNRKSIYPPPDRKTKENHLIKSVDSNDILHANILNAIDTRLKTLTRIKRTSTAT